MKQENISRKTFLKTSGLFAAGMTFLPGFINAAVTGLSGDITIVLPSRANETENRAATALQKYLAPKNGKAIAIAQEDAFKGKSAIYIGATAMAKSKSVDVAGLPDDGYTYKPFGNNLIIAGGAGKGTLYGVYDFLEALGIRKFAPNTSYIPEKIRPYPAAGTFKPLIRYRTTSYGQMGDEEYTAWHKLSSRSEWGLFVHTFNTLVPPQEYGQSHPEYFSLIKGVRSPGTQLCLSNDEVASVLIANLTIKIAEKPAATYWSVSQNDNDQHCTCGNCKALDEKYGNVPSGSMAYFVNKVARAVPDKIISTLAYWYTRKAPKNIRLEPNVNIMLCNIESRRQAPVYETDPAFSNDLKDWGALTKDILLWDYNIQFTNFFAPFPNLHTIKPNIKFYTDNHVNALFMQSNSEPAAEMALLRSYLICKLMWQPGLDDKTIINEFVNGYYGAGGQHIRQYIEVMQQALAKSGMKLDIFGDPIDAKEGFLSADMMSRYNALFDKAENAVKNNADLLRRVQVARLPIMYAAIQIGRTEIDTPRGMFRHTPAGTIVGKPEMKALVQRFVDGCNRENVSLVRERAGSPDHFLAAYTRIFNNMEETPGVKSFKKKITPVTSPAPGSKGVEALTDGVFGSYEAWQKTDPNWVFYTGEHMDFVLDLGELMPVTSVNMDFLNPQAQPDWHLFALPVYVSYALSEDGQQYDEPVRIDNTNNPNPQENPQIIKISILPFRADMNGSRARYIKVHAENLLKMPSWHIRSGQPASIYSDQIVVL